MDNAMILECYVAGDQLAANSRKLLLAVAADDAEAAWAQATALAHAVAMFQVLLDGPTYGVGSTEPDVKAWDDLYKLPFWLAMDPNHPPPPTAACRDERSGWRGNASPLLDAGVAPGGMASLPASPHAISRSLGRSTRTNVRAAARSRRRRLRRGGAGLARGGAGARAEVKQRSALFSAGGSLLFEGTPFSSSKGPFSLGTVSLIAITIPSFSFIVPFFSVAWHPSSGRRPSFSGDDPSILASESICLDLAPCSGRKLRSSSEGDHLPLSSDRFSLADVPFHLSSIIFSSAAIERLLSASLFFLKEDGLFSSNDRRPASEHAPH
jgi:hypothetical protein